MEQDLEQKRFTLNLITKFFKVTGLMLVLFAVFYVCNLKLSELRNSNDRYGHLSAEESIKQLNCLTKNIYWEAASEPFEGKVAVAQVTLNRAESGRWASSVCGVVYQKNVFYQKVVCQFSWYCESNHLVKPVHKEMWKESEDVAKRVMLENFRLPSLKDAYYYHADYVNPKWQKPRLEKIGRHIFYGERT